MDVRIKSTDFNMSDTVARYLDGKIAHIEKLLGGTAEGIRCEVEVGRDAGRPRHGKNIWFAEFTIIRPGQGKLRATNHSESINGAIDDAKAELERQIRGEKGQERRSKRKAGALGKRLLRLE